MSRVREWLVRFWATLRGRRHDADLEAELRLHLELAAEHERRLSGSGTHGRRAAFIKAGTLAPTMESLRDQRGLPWISDLIRDCAYAWRGLRRQPTFALTAILTLALAIGANASIFSLADAVIFRALPVAHPEELARVQITHPRSTSGIFSYPRYREIRDRTQAFSLMAAAGSYAIPEPVVIEHPDGSRRDSRSRLTLVSGTYFEALGVKPAVGRLLTSQDDTNPGGHPVTVVSHRFWQRELAGSQPPIATRIVHNGVSYQVVGVTPEFFTGISSNDDPDLWMPLMMSTAVLGRETLNANSSSLYVFGRLKPGIPLSAASADMARIYRELEPEDAEAGMRGEAVSMARGVQTLRSQFERPLLVLLAIAGVLLLMASVNLAALSIARTAARRHEMAVRLSLGASRLRLWRQCLVESLLLGLIGGASGVALSAWATSALIAIVTTSTRRLPLHFTVDSRLLIFAALVSLASVALFGILPAIQAGRTRITRVFASLRARTRLPGSRPLIAVQMALSMFLLIGAGLFVRSLVNLRTLDAGFLRDDVLVLMLDPRIAYGEDIGKYLALPGMLTERIAAIPGVRSASFSSATFFGSSISRGNVTYEGHAAQAPREEWPIKVSTTPDFVDTLGLSLVAGRAFSSRDVAESPRVAIVSESIARRYFPDGPAVGRRFAFDSTFQPANAVEIVGVVRDVHYNNLRTASPYTVYLPFAQVPSQRMDLQVRTHLDAMAMASQVQEVIRRHDPGVRIVHTVTLDRLVADSIAQDRLLALLGGWVAVMALALSAIGIVGVTAHAVERRTPEIGLRVALGASMGQVRWSVLRETAVLIVTGGLAGAILAFAASDAVRGLLFDLTPADPLTLLASGLVLVVIASVAAYLPARHASRIDPWRALQRE